MSAAPSGLITWTSFREGFKNLFESRPMCDPSLHLKGYTLASSCEECATALHIMCGHIRRCARDPSRLRQALFKMVADDQTLFAAIVNMVELDAKPACVMQTRQHSSGFEDQAPEVHMTNVQSGSAHVEVSTPAADHQDDVPDACTVVGSGRTLRPHVSLVTVSTDTTNLYSDDDASWPHVHDIAHASLLDHEARECTPMSVCKTGSSKHKAKKSSNIGPKSAAAKKITAAKKVTCAAQRTCADQPCHTTKLLTTGWSCIQKTRASGKSKGSTDKYYRAPDGKLFRSLSQASRYMAS